MSQARLAPELSVGGSWVSVVARPGSAVSEESRAVRDAMEAIVNSVEKSEALFGGKAAAIAQIWTLVDECSELGWTAMEPSPLTALPPPRPRT